MQESDVLAGRLCQFDSLTVSTRQIKYSAKPEGRKKSMEQFAQFKREMETSSATLQKKIDARESFYLVDVREPEEHQQFNIGGILMPLQDLLKKKSFVFSHNDTVILYCKMGGRSLTAAKYLSDQGFKNVFSLHSGINAWKRQ